MDNRFCYRRTGLKGGYPTDRFERFAQAQTTPKRLTFDVATIRLSNANDLNGGIKALPGGNGYSAKNIPIKLMISLMYRVPMRQITGEPDWVRTDRYDIEARVDGRQSCAKLCRSSAGTAGRGGAS